MLSLRYTATTSVPVEIEGLTPEFALGKPAAEIERFEVYHGNRKLPLAEFFAVSGVAGDDDVAPAAKGVKARIEFEGNLAGVHWIGAKMTGGEIHVHGAAGRHLGSDMTAGTIHVDGDAGDWVGGEMHGGFIHVRGRAGHLIGAAYRGSRRGMTGGTILIGGDAGNEVGHTMRRGLIAIGGKSGDTAGFNMLAGTIFLFGESGIRHGAGMKRGTIGLFGDKNPTLLPTFRHACRHQPVALRVALHTLRRQGFAVSDDLFNSEFDLHNGDFLEGGRGEVLVRA